MEKNKQELKKNIGGRQKKKGTFYGGMFSQGKKRNEKYKKLRTEMFLGEIKKNMKEE